MNLTDWAQRGYQDHHESTPYRRAPELPAEELQTCAEQARPEVNAYWEGFFAGNADTARRLLAGRPQEAP